MAVIVVAEITVTAVAALPPSVTVAPGAKLVPVMVMTVPPVVEPFVGATPVMGGGGPTYENPFARVALCVSGLVTTTFTAPAAWAGVVAVIVVAETTVTAVAAMPPTLTVAPDAKLVPVNVSAVPPVVDPEVGATLVSVDVAVEPGLPAGPSGNTPCV